MKSQVVFVDGEAQVATVVYNDEIYTATVDHPNFLPIVESLLDDSKDASVLDLFDIARSVERRFEKVSERVNLANGEVLFDGEPVDNSLTKQVLRFLEEGVEDYRPLVAFLEKVMLNTNDHSRTQLFDWLQRHSFTIDFDGDIIGYKGVRVDHDGTYTSISQGPAIVDGVPVPHGYVPNPVGAVVEIARSKVEHNPAVGCASGLHFGTWDYASGFARGAVLKVKVNPRDVVSVPTDCGWAKCRTTRYHVLDVVTAPVSSALDEDVYSSPVTVTRDTRQNHKTQRRDSYGRFLPKSS